jgi:hypothetical protein
VFHARAVDERAVARAEVVELDARLVRDERRVSAGYGGVEQWDVARDARPTVNAAPRRSSNT